MSKRIEAGSLICARRKVPGMGLVLERVKDIDAHCGHSLSTEFELLYNADNPRYYNLSEYKERQKKIDSINNKILEKNSSIDKGLLKEFWMHNRAYSFRDNALVGKKVLEAKRDFCLVKWLKAPSDYDDRPSSWYKKGLVWMSKSSIKNLT